MRSSHCLHHSADRIRIVLIVLGWIFSVQSAHSQKIIDSLLTVLRQPIHDTVRVQTLEVLCDRYWLTGQYDLTEKYADSMLTIARASGYRKGEAKALFAHSKAMVETGNPGKGLEDVRAAQRIFSEVGDRKGVANMYNSMGRMYGDLTNYPEAIKNYQASQRILLEIGDKKGVGVSCNNIGNVFFSQGNLNEAYKNFSEAIRIRTELNDQPGLASTYHNISNVYNKRGEYQKALEYYNKALDINTGLGKKNWISHNLVGIGEVYENMGDYRKALHQYNEGLLIKRQVGDKVGIASCMISIARAMTHLKYFGRTQTFLDSALLLSREAGARDMVVEAYKAWAELAAAQGDHKTAYQKYALYTEVRDSMLSADNLRQVSMLNAEFDLERKENEIKNLSRENEMNEERAAMQARRKNLVIGGIAAILILTGVFSYLLYRRLQFSTRQKQIIEKQQKNILDSIRYAQIIQNSIIPGEAEFDATIPFENFVLYRPREIVSGDFYWAGKSGDRYVVAAADCTGHGVPGAFLTMMGSMLMNETVQEKGINSPDRIVARLNRGIETTLSHNRGQYAVGDGMDISVCAIDPKAGKVYFTGAMHPILFGRQGQELVTWKGDSISVGGNPVRSDADDVKFSLQEMNYQSGDVIYLFTDGYIDQFSSENKQRLGSRRFKQILEEIRNLPMKEQKVKLIASLESWKKDRLQLDDILVIGIRF